MAARDTYELDFGKVFKDARERRAALEINSF